MLRPAIFSETYKEEKRAKIRNEFFYELELTGIERETYFDPVESGKCSNIFDRPFSFD